LGNRRKLAPFLGVLAPAVLLLMADLAIGDFEFFTLINQGLANPILDIACAYVSPVLFSGFYVLTLAALFFSVNVKSRATAILSIANGILSYVGGSLIKPLVQRPRPELLAAARVLSEARIVGFWHTSAFSFPSTTVMLALGLTLPILLEKRRIGLVLVGLSYLMGFAVIYTGFHFPLDVAAGAFFSWAPTLCIDRVKKPLIHALSRTKPKEQE